MKAAKLNSFLACSYMAEYCVKSCRFNFFSLAFTSSEFDSLAELCSLFAPRLPVILFLVAPGLSPLPQTQYVLCCGFPPLPSSGIYTPVKLLGRKSDFWSKAEPAGQVNVKHNICADLWPNPTRFLIQGPFAPCPAGSGLGNAARDALVVPEPLSSSWEISKSLPQEFPRVWQHSANSDPGWAFWDQGRVLQGDCSRNLLCQSTLAETHSHSGHLSGGDGQIYGRLGKCWLMREEKCPMARAGEELSWQS